MIASSFIANAGLKNNQYIVSQYTSKKVLPIFYFPYKETGSKKLYWVVVSYGEVSAGYFHIGFEGMVKATP